MKFQRGQSPESALGVGDALRKIEAEFRKRTKEFGLKLYIGDSRPYTGSDGIRYKIYAFCKDHYNLFNIQIHSENGKILLKTVEALNGAGGYDCIVKSPEIGHGIYKRSWWVDQAGYDPEKTLGKRIKRILTGLVKLTRLPSLKR